jgi:hypothetical protein
MRMILSAAVLGQRGFLDWNLGPSLDLAFAVVRVCFPKSPGQRKREAERAECPHRR